MSRAGAALAALLATTAAFAAPTPAPPASEPFDPGRSQAVFKVGMRLPLRVEGRFDRAEGELLRLAGSRFRVHARLDGRGLRMKGPEWLRRLTLSEDFLDVRRHPDIRFDSIDTDADLLHAGGRLQGQLQLRGQRREVDFELLPARCERPGSDCDIQVVGRLNRHDFGMRAYRLSVRDEVSFEFRIRLAEPVQ